MILALSPLSNLRCEFIFKVFKRTKILIKRLNKSGKQQEKDREKICLINWYDDSLIFFINSNCINF